MTDYLNQMKLKKLSIQSLLFLLLVFGSNHSTWCQSDTIEINNTGETARFERNSPRYMRDLRASTQSYFESGKAGYKQYKRMEHYMMNRLGEGGKLVNISALNYKAYNDYVLTHPTGSGRGVAHNGHWSFIGPVGTNPHPDALSGGIGRVNRFAFHPTDSNIVYAATAGGGLWKTNDKGLQWEPLSDGIPVMSAADVAVDFTDPDIIYVLTGDGALGSFYYFNDFSPLGIGVIKTVNGGNLWQPTGLTFNETQSFKAYNLNMDPTDHMNLYACTGAGLFRTQDGGTTWDTIKTGIIYEMQFKPGDSDRIYCVDTSYVYVSNNGGDTWIDSTHIPPINGSYGRMTIAVCPDDPARVYLVASPVDDSTAMDPIVDFRGFWQSTNSGLDFTLISTRPNITASDNGNEFKSQAWYDFASVCNPLDADEVIVGAIGLWKTGDAGETWTTDGGVNSLYHADIQGLQVNPLDNTLYVANDGGVFISEDFGETFEFRSGGLAITQYFKLANSPFASEFVLAGAQDNGVHLRDENENLFDHVIFGDGMESLFHPTAPSLVLSSIHNGDILLSQDTGRTFSNIFNPKDSIYDDIVVEWTTPMALDANDQFTIYLGFKPIMKSVDQGQTFFATSGDNVSGHKILVNNTSYPGRLYAGDCINCSDDTNNLAFRFYKSVNYGATWDRIDTNFGFPDTSFVIAAALNPDDSLEIWVTCGRYEDQHKVYRSMDGGMSWQNKSGSLPNVPVSAIAFHDTDGAPSGAVYIGTDIGVFYRDDELNDWIYFSNNLPRVEVTDLDIDYLGGWLRASTYGRGLWQSELYTTCQPTLSFTTANQVLGHSYYHQASQQIFSTAHVDGYGSQVIYACEGVIQLTEGFRATAARKATFKALLRPCDQGGYPAPLHGGLPPERQR